MTSTDNAKDGGAQVSGLKWLPVAWLVLSMGLASYRFWLAWPALNDYRLPEAATNLIYGELAVSVITVLVGLYVLALALSAARTYPPAFVFWQGIVIAAIVAVMIYTAIMPDFVTQPLTYAIGLGEIIIGIACIIIVRRKPRAEPALSSLGASPPLSVLARIIFSFLGVLVGGFIGFWIGLGVGAVISETTHISCFEGACGYFAVFLGLAGILVGAIVGLGLALLWTRKRKA